MGRAESSGQPDPGVSSESLVTRDAHVSLLTNVTHLQLVRIIIFHLSLLQLKMKYIYDHSIDNIKCVLSRISFSLQLCS